jgi:hypothetical protein
MMRVVNHEVLDHDKAILDAQCPECGGKIKWERLNGDAGKLPIFSTKYVGQCCGKTFWLYPATVTVKIDDPEEE